jgi:hypothetical protein
LSSKNQQIVVACHQNVCPSALRQIKRGLILSVSA